VIIRGSLRTVLLIAVVLLGLGACSNGSVPPRQTSTVTVTPTATSTSPSASPTPALPAAAQQPSRAGAGAFARYFFEVYNYAFWNADPAPLRAISGPDCLFCKSSIEAVESIRMGRDRVEGGEARVTVALAAPGNPSERMLVNLVLDQDAGKTYSSSGEVIGTTVERKHGRMDMSLRWVSGRWIVLAADVIKAGES
jgi:hypothetical protein